MNLDQQDLYQQLDPSRLIDRITFMPEQLEQAFTYGQSCGLLQADEIRLILTTGCGGIAAGADCLSAYVEPTLTVPMLAWRQHYLPAWAKGRQTLVVIQAPSGDADQALAITEQAVRAGCTLLYMGGDGPAVGAVSSAGGQAWVWPEPLDARHATTVTFGLLYRFLERVKLLPEPGEDLVDALRAMREVRLSLTPDVSVARNPAKRLAGQMVGRWAMVFASEFLAPVAKRWIDQLNNMANSGGQFELIPEADYNTLAGMDHPISVQRSLFTIFMRAGQFRQDSLRRLDLTREICMHQGLNTDFVNARGNSRLAQLWTTLLFGDFSAYYLAIANDVDPALTEVIEYFESEWDNHNHGGM
jgi:glucose/mannose-6-phosphate isomerase